MRDEFQRRQSLEDRLYEFILRNPRVWLHGRDMRPSGGDAWRSRLTNVRKRLDDLGLDFKWNKKHGIDAAYMLREKTLGPSAHVYREASLF